MGWYMLFFGQVSGSVTLADGKVVQSQSPTIWQSDGTGHGTTMILASEGVDPVCTDPVPAAGALMLFYDNGKIYAPSHGSQLLVWDTHQFNAQGIPGAAPLREWTHDVYDYTANDNPAGTPLNPQGFTQYNGRVYFNGTFGGKTAQGAQLLTSVQELFTTDHLEMIPGPGGVGAGLNPTSLTVAFDKLFFAGNDPSSGNNVLFAYDGHATPGPAPGVDVSNPPFNPAYLTFFPDSARLFMSGQDSTGDTWLWQYDGTHQPTKIDPTSSGLQPYNLVYYLVTEPFQCQGRELQIGAEILFFSGVRNDGKRGLWMSLGTKDTTQEIPTPTPSGADGDDSLSVYPFNLTSFAGGIYFTAYDTYINGFPSGRGLFAYDPFNNKITEPHHSSKVNFDPGSAIPTSGGLSQITMTSFPPDSDLYFSGSTGVDIGYANLWRANLGVPGQQGIGGEPAPPATVVYSNENFDLGPVWLTYQWI